ncbi:hypothetical protein [Desulfuromonas sp. AOP6]|uniref:hypothetical protein n=1 Tax=Desulfuromonas sp. AOP6 TaxID=1566351 RepID=UPI0012DE8DEE|nr:hypothetical protein [Desulfuromonas sp. AOP6]
MTSLLALISYCFKRCPSVGPAWNEVEYFFVLFWQKEAEGENLLNLKPSGSGPTAGFLFFGRKEKEPKETLLFLVPGGGASWRQQLI